MRAAVVVTAMCLSAVGLSAASDVQAAIRKSTSIPAQGLGPALQVLAKEHGFQLVYRPEFVRDRQTPGAVGELTPEEALSQLLRGTGLTHRRLDEKTVTIVPQADEGTPLSPQGDSPQTPGTPDPRTAKKPGFWSRFRLAQADTSERSEEENKNPSSRDNEKKVIELEEIVVTGSHIRGAAPIGSPVLVFDREQIEASGYGRLQDFLEYLPQNFSGSASEDISIDSGASNLTRGQAIDLRGLGASSTLILVNGRRQPAGGLDGSFVDISSIAASAIERVEIMPDGASAVYGSDAIGGVVNFILRKDYEGAETNLRFATNADGAAEEVRASQLLGLNLGDGNVLVGYQYSRRDALMAADMPYASLNRDFRSLGGDDLRTADGSPGNILNPTTRVPAYAIPQNQDGRNLEVADLISGEVNYTNFVDGIDHLPEQVQHSAFGTMTYSISDRVSAFAEGRYSKRDMKFEFAEPAALVSVPASNPFYVNPFSSTAPVLVRYSFRDDVGLTTQESSTETYTLGTGVAAQLGARWQLSTSASYGREKNEWENYNVINNGSPAFNAAIRDSNPATALNVFGDGATNNPATIQSILFTSLGQGISKIGELTVEADGPLLGLPGGEAKVAVGMDYRDERVSADRHTVLPATGVVTRSATSVGDLDRQVAALYGELIVPIFGRANGMPGVRTLEVALAGRYEDYSDFGSTTNPKVGINWVPWPGIRLRGSLGTSFRAPRFNEVSTDARPPTAGTISNIRDPRSPTGFSDVLSLRGANPDLREETATVWTAGFDFSPANLAGFMASATYFDLNYEDKIQVPTAGSNVLLLENEWAEIIHRDPTREQIDEICNDPTFSGSCPLAPAAIIDNRLRNIAGVTVRGVDFDLRYQRSTRFGNGTFGVSGSYLLAYERALTSTSPSADVVDTVGNPLALRLQGTVGWAWGQWSIRASTNYVGEYRDPAQNRKVGSWMTLDAGLGYQMDAGWMRGTRVQLSVVNALDKEPPFVNQALGGTTGGYDLLNFGQVGRCLSLAVTKDWGRH